MSSGSPQQNEDVNEVLRIQPWSACPVILVLKPKGLCTCLGLGLGMLSYLFISASHTYK